VPVFFFTTQLQKMTTNENANALNEQLEQWQFRKCIYLPDILAIVIRRNLSHFDFFTEVHFDVHTKMEAKLYCQREERSGLFRFIKYHALLRYNGHPEKDRYQTFYIDQKIGIREAFNLLQGRSVCKPIARPSRQAFSVWMWIDFSPDRDERNDYHYRYMSAADFPLEQILRQYPILDLNTNESYQDLIGSLKSGDRYLATIARPGGNEQVYIEASPVSNSIVFHPHPGDMPPL